MFENDTDADETISRRNVLKTAGGTMACSAVLVSLGAQRGAAETEESLQAEVREFTEEYIAVEMRFPNEVFDDGLPGLEFPNEIFLGHADQFLMHEDDERVSLPEETEGLTNPVETERLDERTYTGYFRTENLDLSEVDGEKVTLGVGAFPERTVPSHYWNSCPGHRDY